MSASDSDRILALAYLDGTLPPGETRAFELRLAREPHLVAALEELSRTEALLRAALLPREASRRATALWIAAAAALLVGLGLWLRARAPEPLAWRMALVETAPSDVGLHELLGVDPDWLPLGMGYRDASGGVPPPADLYARTLGAAFEQHVSRTLASDAPARPMRAFVLALRPERDAQAIVVSADDEGRLQQVFPGPEESARLRAGALRLLPRSPVELPADWEESQRIHYTPGVLTRAGVSILVALRGDELDGRSGAFEAAWEEQLQAARDQLGAGSGGARALESLRAWLQRRGFDARVLAVAPR